MIIQISYKIRGKPSECRNCGMLFENQKRNQVKLSGCISRHHKFECEPFAEENTFMLMKNADGQNLVSETVKKC